ncbi:MAG: hypothetical protein MJZ67_04920 [Bacteroidales bacterium]|nr:hypothetical protein [Bacteroidales bacterium]
MKKILTVLLLILSFSCTVYAQVPKGFTYQAVARNTAGQLMNRRAVGVRITIRQYDENGPVVYTQVERISTNDNGLFTINVGEGNSQFSSIEWGNGPYFLVSELDPQGGADYSLSTAQKIMSVPYAQYANFAESVVNYNERDPYFRNWGFRYDSLRNAPTRLSQFLNDLNFLTANDIALTQSDDTIRLTGGSYVVVHHPTTMPWDSIIGHPTMLSQFFNDQNFLTANDIFLTRHGDTIFLTGGSYIVLPSNNGTIEWDSIVNRPTNLSQFVNDLGLSLSQSGDTIFFTDGSFVVVHHPTTMPWDSITGRPTSLSQFTNDLSLELTRHGDTLFLTGGSYVILPSGNSSVSWDSISNRPTNLSQFFNDLSITSNGDTIFFGNSYVVVDHPTTMPWDSITGRPINLSQFNNDLGYLTANDIALSQNGDTIRLTGGSYAVVHHPTTMSWDSITGRPTNLSQFNNDLGFITGESQGLADVLLINNRANSRIRNLSTPVDPQDAVNKAYVDARVVILNGRIDSINHVMDSVVSELQSQLDRANDRIFELEHPEIQGSLPGIFSVSTTNRVKFSQGNLQYRPRVKTWRFSTNQYDIAGSANNNVVMMAYCNSWVDLFGYGTSGWDGGAGRYMPYETSTNDSEYTESTDGDDLSGLYANADWGFYNRIINGGNQAGIWRTLTYSEWTYLLTLRPNATMLRGMATVVSTAGYVLLPDNWTCPAGLTFVNTNDSFLTNVYSAEDWALMEAAGAVFLPAAGSRNGSSTSSINALGNYWTSSHIDGSHAYSFHIGAGDNAMQNTMNYSTGCSVRLVREY